MVEIEQPTNTPRAEPKGGRWMRTESGDIVPLRSMLVEQLQEFGDPKLPSNPLISEEDIKEQMKPVASAREKCLEPYVLDTFLGEGSNGKVFASCKSGNFLDPCNTTVVKISKHANDTTIASEYRWMQMLYNFKLNGHHIVPYVEKQWTCDNETYMAIERFSGDLWKLGLDQGQSFQQIFLFTMDQILSMISIANLLGENQIIHGDLKPDNFLWKPNPESKTNPQIIVVTDFGFSGFANTKPFATLGWSNSSNISDKFPGFGCPLKGANLMKPASISATEFAKITNLIQLEASLLDPNVTWFSSGASLYVFGGINGLNRGTVANVCLNYQKWYDMRIQSLVKLFGNKVRTLSI
jgi:serine/threonine protein kinase